MQVTDGELPNPPLAVEDNARLVRMRGDLGASVHGLLVGKTESVPLGMICSQVHTFLNRLDFGGRVGGAGSKGGVAMRGEGGKGGRRGWGMRGGGKEVGRRGRMGRFVLEAKKGGREGREEKERYSGKGSKGKKKGVGGAGGAQDEDDEEEFYSFEEDDKWFEELTSSSGGGGGGGRGPSLGEVVEAHVIRLAQEAQEIALADVKKRGGTEGEVGGGGENVEAIRSVIRDISEVGYGVEGVHGVRSRV